MIAFDTWQAIVTLLAKAGNTVDAGRLDDWLDCFAEHATYHVLSRENYERKLPLTLFQCDNKNMMRDRVLSLREANVVNIHRDQHVTGLPEITDRGDGSFDVTSAYAVYQTDQGGFSRLFSAGVYYDNVSVADGRAAFNARRAVVDTFAIQNMLSTPI
ncbi:aromatic-ring-hydroxylating dioxygenase subunit beta [Chitinasiproducens palmae]|uniref:Anthranilate 1,2-dioxygenase small subunit n=1 Tax=Chitinasiproducens palmae TaxID=1770053 RepID=A0A1H2PKF8_9BURK|nr:aromatic-ring-hydroxylating dioxygenase subunit beta [Chitinasiproducens palmae]SDV46825.1 anthranilate 1,2-dioxygenase small subunit [Chitinasiproducens palmae]